MKPADYNKDELSSLAPKLSSIEKREVFSVPDGYFNSLSDKIMDKVAASPAFEEIAVANPFNVPESYFETLPLHIINRIETAQSKRFSLGDLLAQALRPKYALTLITACLTLFICIKFFEKPIHLNASQFNANATNNVSLSESDVLGEVDENTLMNTVANENDPILISNNYRSAADKNMEDYIINNNIDISDIAKEL